mgnify:CR=1 FL=1
MTAAVAIKLLAVLVTAAIGYLAGRMKWLVAGASGSDEIGRASCRERV